MILYEYPFNERIRTYLRLEHLFIHLQQLLPRVDALDHHFALASMFEILEVSSRADLKSDLLKDLDRQKHVLDSYRGNPAIAESVLDDVIGKLDACFAALNALPGKAGQVLTENDWLMSIRSRVGIPGGTCEFDLPAYFAWQHLPADARRDDLERWANAFGPFAESIHMLLKLLRDLANVAPMVGLLGTVIGLMSEFTRISKADMQQAQMEFAGGTAEALINTAAGLVIAIPAMMIASLYRGKVNTLVSELESAATHIMALLSSQYKRVTAARAAQAAARAPTVFNFYEPDYILPGALAAAGLYAPEFQILTDTTAITTPNYLYNIIYSTRTATAVGLDLTNLLPLARSPQQLVDYMNLVLSGGTMPKTMTDLIVSAVTRMPASTSDLDKVRSALYLTVSSPEGSIQK